MKKENSEIVKYLNWYKKKYEIKELEDAGLGKKK